VSIAKFKKAFVIVDIFEDGRAKNETPVKGVSIMCQERLTKKLG
jgi:hypothetical protein